MNMDNGNISSQKVWAKISSDHLASGGFTWLSVWQHGVDAALVAKRLFDDFLSPQQRRNIADACGSNEELAKKIIMFLCGAHDVGKIAPLFALGSRVNEQQKQFILNNMAETDLLNEELIAAHYDRQIVRHCFSGAYYLEQWLKDTKGIKRKPATQLTSLINGHHGEWRKVGFPAKQELGKEQNSGGTAWGTARSRFLDAISNFCGMTDDDWREIADCKIDVATQMLLSGLIVMSDWIASNTEFFPLLEDGNVASENEEEARVEEGFSQLSLPSIYTFDDILPEDRILPDRFGIPGATLNDMQTTVARLAQELADMVEPGLLVVQEEMGKGKTEAALIAAETLSQDHANGVLFALPTQATTNAMLPRFVDWISSLEPDLGFAMQHSAAKANRKYDEMRTRSKIDANEKDLPHINTWFEGSRKGILAPFALCTIDQVLMSALNCRFVSLKHLGIGTKTIIADEIHSSDLYMQCFLNKAIEWCAANGISMIMLSATLSKEQCYDMLESYYRGANGLGAGVRDATPFDKREISYPSISIATKSGIETYKIDRTDAPKCCGVRMCPGWDENKLVEEAYRKIAGGGTCGIVCNTVNTAQSIYQQVMNKKTDDMEVILLHSRYTAADRATAEAKLLNALGKKQTVGNGRPDKMIVVGTQVIEQSLDIDLDYMFSYLAPIDLILQRIGREHRHPVHNEGRPSELREPEIAIVGYDVHDGKVFVDRGASFVYDKILLLKTLSVLYDYNGKSIQMPNDIEHLMDMVYEADSTPTPIGDAEKWEKDITHAMNDFIEKKKTLELQANRFILGSPTNSNDLVSLAGSDETQKDDENASGVRLGISSAQAILLRECDGGVRFISAGDNDSKYLINDSFKASDIIDNVVPLPAGISGAYGDIDKDSGEKQSVVLDKLSAEHAEQYHLQAIAASSYAHRKKVLVIPAEGSLRVGTYLLSYDNNMGVIATKD